MDVQLRDRWHDFVEALEGECWTHRQDPGVLEANESLKVSLPLDDGSRFSREFSEHEILDGDLRALASEFYTSYKAQRDGE